MNHGPWLHVFALPKSYFLILWILGYHWILYLEYFASNKPPPWIASHLQGQVTGISSHTPDFLTPNPSSQLSPVPLLEDGKQGLCVKRWSEHIILNLWRCDCSFGYRYLLQEKSWTKRRECTDISQLTFDSGNMTAFPFNLLVGPNCLALCSRSSSYQTRHHPVGYRGDKSLPTAGPIKRLARVGVGMCLAHVILSFSRPFDGKDVDYSLKAQLFLGCRHGLWLCAKSREDYLLGNEEFPF